MAIDTTQRISDASVTGIEYLQWVLEKSAEPYRSWLRSLQFILLGQVSLLCILLLLARVDVASILMPAVGSLVVLFAVMVVIYWLRSSVRLPQEFTDTAAGLVEFGNLGDLQARVDEYATMSWESGRSWLAQGLRDLAVADERIPVLEARLKGV